jgi:transketolase
MTTKQLEKKANEIRQDIIKMLLEAESGHSAGSLGMVDIFTAFYFAILNHDPKKPDWSKRDRLIVSNGHVCPAQYATMAHAGYFSKEKLSTLGDLGSSLQGHPEREKLPGIETTSGPLGCGLAQAAGMAYAARMDKKKFRVYCTTSDGEHDEGNHWEAVMFIAKNKLSNLTMIIDRNNIQVEGHTEDVMPLEPLKEKYEAFNWHVLDVDGHNIEEIIDAANHAKAIYEKPTVIIAHTIPGKGVDFMEWDPEWHAKAPDMEQAKKAIKELKTLGGKIK